MLAIYKFVLEWGVNHEIMSEDDKGLTLRTIDEQIRIVG
jgi:hypothetical protein